MLGHVPNLLVKFARIVFKKNKNLHSKSTILKFISLEYIAPLNSNSGSYNIIYVPFEIMVNLCG